MKSTLHDRYVEGLTARGESPVTTTSTKHTKMTRGKGGFYFIGRSGSLRVGRTKQASLPVSQKFKDYLLGISALRRIADEDQAAEREHRPVRHGHG